MGQTPPELLKRALAKRVVERADGTGLMPSAVMVLLYPKAGEYCILLNKRSEQVEHHKGEISFPGGAKDSEDRDSLETALRETEEEMGINRDDITVIGEMDEVVTRSNFLINVFTGTIEYPYPFKPSFNLGNRTTSQLGVPRFPVCHLGYRCSSGGFWQSPQRRRALGVRRSMK